jgi:hypothetical protein
LHFQRSGRQAQEHFSASGEKWPQWVSFCIGVPDSSIQSGDLRPQRAVVNPYRIHPLAEIDLSAE